MTDEQKVKKVYPDAEVYLDFGGKCGGFAIGSPAMKKTISDGRESRDEAWADAASRLLAESAPEPLCPAPPIPTLNGKNVDMSDFDRSYEYVGAEPILEPSAAELGQVFSKEMIVNLRRNVAATRSAESRRIMTRYELNPTVLYEIHPKFNPTRASDNGEFVYYTDHIEMVNRLHAEIGRLNVMVKQIDHKYHLAVSRADAVVSTVKTGL